MPARDRGRRAGLAALFATALLALAAPLHAGPYDPRLQFRTLTTPHFVIHFHQGEEPLAGRLASRIEAIGARLARALGCELPAPTHVVLVDQRDLSNGTATVLPVNAITIDVVPPSGLSFLGNTDDWLQYVFTHEYAHILHLDRSRGWARLARAVFGRTPLAFPNLSLPLWQVEGLATFSESAEGAGRLHAGDFRAIVAEAARAGRFEPLDRVGGGLVDWPSGQGVYAYGGLFHQFLAERYGHASIARLADRTAGRLPYFTKGAFEDEYGRTLEDLWREFARSRIEEAGETIAPAGRRLTHLGFLVDAPRLDADGALLFTASTPDDFPAVYRLAAGGEPERLVERSGGRGLVARPDWLIFDQLEVVRAAGLVSDLYLFDRRSGDVRRLTREARLVDPALSPDDARLAAVRLVPGGRQLVVLDARRLLDAGGPINGDALPVLHTAGGSGDVFAGPRWSPDGRFLAVEHRALDGPSRILVVDGAAAERHVVTSTDARNVTPAWTPDGRLLFASDRETGVFQIYVWEGAPDDDRAAPVRRVTEASGGMHSPLATGDGDLVAVGYSVDGFDLWQLLARVRDASAPAVAPAAAAELKFSPPGRPASRPSSIVNRQSSIGNGQSIPYTPWSTLAPRGWLPLVEYRDERWRAGAAIAAADVLGRHAVAAAATWGLGGGGAPGRLAPQGRPDWSAAYAYRRWQPSYVVAASDRTALFSAFAEGAPLPVGQREQQFSAGVVLPLQRVRRAQSLLALFHHERVTTQVPGARRRQTRAGLRAGWSLTTAREYGYSISPEEGIALGVTAELFRPGFGGDARADAWSVDARGYVRLGRSHAVLALRAAGAASVGEADHQRVYRLGGSDGDAAPGGFGSDAVSLLRGFPNGVFAGTRVAVTNVEARVPLWRPQRGPGSWPLFLRAIHLTSYLDVGHAWTGGGHWRDRKTSAGVELGADLIAGFGLPVTWSAGVGWGRDGARLVPDNRAVYVRVGRAF